MKSLQNTNPELLEAFIKLTQYLVRLKAQQDIWAHLGQFIITYFPAAWAAFLQRDPQGEILMYHSTLAEADAAQLIGTDAVHALIADVLDSGFLTTAVIRTPAPTMTAILPIAEGGGRPSKVLLIGHQSTEPLPRELMNLYLAIADLAGVTFERLHNERELNRHRDHLEELVKARTAELEAVIRELDSFSYSVSHDLRSPLRSLAGFSQVLIEDYSACLDEEGRDAISRIQAATLRMGELIDDLLKLSRVSRSELKWEEVRLDAIARKIVQELERTEPSRKAEFVIADGLTAKGDARLLQVALDNLLGNAWKFTGNNQLSRIEFGVIGGDRLNTKYGADNVVAAGELSQGKTVYYIRDNGVGFAMAYAHKLGGPFQRLHKTTEFPGTGIGLATVKRIISRHGGKLWVEGEEGKGATFYFTLC